MHAIGTGGAPLCQYGQDHFVPEKELPDHPVTTSVLPCTPRAGTEGELFQNHRVPEKENASEVSSA